MTAFIRWCAVVVLLLVLLTSGIRAAPANQLPAWQGKVEAWVIETAEVGETEFLIYLTEQADLSGAEALLTKQDKGRYVFERLTETARRTQGSLIAALQAAGAEFRPYWVANMIWARGDIKLVQEIASRPDVARLFANPWVRLEETAQLPEPLMPQAPQTVEWNIARVNADDVWAAGYTGQGVVVAGQDTGYDWDHPALINQYRGWDGVAANHNYNWHDAIHENNPNSPPGNPCGFDSPLPCDDYTHGTHTMGIMVGDDGLGNQIGMAPGARWIGCRNMEQGWGTPATYAECYQWFIAPTDLTGNNPRPELAPDVINNSWSCPAAEGCTDPNVLLTVVDNVRQAGILTVHSAGNDGYSGCSSINTPAAIYASSFTVGSTDINDLIAPSSSRGPVTIDGSYRIKPDVVAPGVNIYSSIPGSGYSSKSGTSMAAPHVAGLAALLLSARPELKGQVHRIEELIEQSALPLFDSTCGGVPDLLRPNNVYGWGRIDSWAAFQSSLLDYLYFPLVINP